MWNKRSTMPTLNNDSPRLATRGTNTDDDGEEETNPRSALIDYRERRRPQLLRDQRERHGSNSGEDMELQSVVAQRDNDEQDRDHAQLNGSRRRGVDRELEEPLLPIEVETTATCKMHTNLPSPERHAGDATHISPITSAAAQKTQSPTTLSPHSGDERVAQLAEQHPNSFNPSPQQLAKSGPLSTPTPTPTKAPSSAVGGATAKTVAAEEEKRRESSNSGVTNGHAASSGGGGGGSGSDDEETDVIGDLVGHFGKWQFLMTILLSLFQVPNTFHISSPIYQAANKNFWCMRPAHLQHVPVDVWRNASHSEDNCFQAPIDWQQGSNATNAIAMLAASQAQTGAVAGAADAGSDDGGAAVGGGSGLNGSRVACTAWEYETNDNLGNTWTSEWDLVCDQEHLKNVAEMFFLLGVATGGIISGYLSDRFGRKKMLFISAVLQTIFGLALYFANSFEMYLTLRALLGLVSVSVTYAGLILAIEYVDGKWRTIAGMYNLFPLPISYMVISGIAYLTQDYQRLQLVIGVPGILLCFLWFVVPESPRWLLVKGRVEDVRRIVEATAKFNGRQLPANYESMLKPPTQEASSQDILCLFRTAYLRRITMCFVCIWFTVNLVYYGLILNMSTFGGNVYLNSALAGLVEIPAIAIAMYIITKVGKKYLFCATLLCAGIACCCAAIAEGEEELLWLKITFLMIGKFTISAGNTIMPVYTAELYPTAIRNVGVGACNVAAGLALILTPYISLLNKIESHLLMTLLTAWSIFGGVVVLFLPETMMAHREQLRQQKSLRTEL